MSAESLVRGWCPSLFRPMESGDGWIARLRPQAGAVPAGLARTAAEAATRFGNGIIEVTNRANIQIRGLTPATIAPFTEAIEAAGGGQSEGSRVLVSPLLGADSSLQPGLGNLAADIDATLRPLRLPAKFGVVLDGGGALPLTGIALDVTIRCRAGAWSVNGAPCAASDIAARVLALAGAAPRVTARGAAQPAPGRYDGFVLVAPAFGQMRAEAFAALAGLAEAHGDGALRPTPWKSLCIAGASAPETLLAAAAALGFIADAHDPRLSIVTCAGLPACARSAVDTHQAAEAMARSRREGDSLIHISGCPKGCAHPGAAPVTLVGRDGYFDLIRSGRASDPPTIHHLPLAEIPALMQRLPHD